MSGWLWVGIVGEWVGTCVDGYVCRVRVCGWVNERVVVGGYSK